MLLAYLSMLLIKGRILLLVYRVNWLRAKARKERWEEEVELVTSEMGWTVNCFEYHMRIWKERAEVAKGAGQMAYAWKRKSTWEKWAELAKDTLETMKGI